MRIKMVHFEAFKSLYDFSMDFDDMTVITGANGSGKSNLVDGLVFLSNTYLHGLELAVSHGGGYENIAHRRTRRARRPIRIVVEVELDRRDIDEGLRYSTIKRDKRADQRSSIASLIIRHEFAFRAVSQSLTADFEVTEEAVSILLEDGRLAAKVDRSANGSVSVIQPSIEEDVSRLMQDLLFAYHRDERLLEMRPEPSELFFSRGIYVDIFWVTKRFLSSIRVFQLSPHTSRVAGVASPRAQLERHGDNLPGAANYLRRNHPDEWSRIEAAMRSIMPTLEEISIAYTEDRRLAVQFHERGLGRAWNSSEVSDGTIQALALLVAIFDPRPSILAIEELENALHPWILRQILDLCQESTRQILLTTHSPVLLTAVPPLSVQLMWMDAGRTSTAPCAVGS
ncbi:AAA family ATPase [Curtobacterium flaccumfaciens]|nr:AAA family ATPase [Curtobacterium flaccumfaciens]